MPAHRTRISRAWLALVTTLAVSLAGCGGAAPTRHTTPHSTSGAGVSGASSSSAGPAADPGYGAPKQGECHRLTAAASLASVDSSRPVPCRDAHTSVVAYVGYRKAPVTARTPLAQRRSLGRRLCEPAYRRLVGGTVIDRATSILTWTLFTPGQAQLERGARWVRCDVLARSGTALVALPDTRPLLARGVPERLHTCEDAQGADVSCGTRHAFRVAAVYAAVGATYPDARTYTTTARARCRQLTKADGGYWQAPSEAAWKAGDRFVRCLHPVAPNGG